MDKKCPALKFPTCRSTKVYNKGKEIATKKRRTDFSKLLQCETPPPVSGRNHNQVQTDLYLEELTDVVETDTAWCQTDPMIDRPPSPLFVPAKTGMDASTEILPGDLFDFDLEVKPILEVLVGKTMEQALLEVCEEEELARIREQQLRYEEIRAADLMEMQRLEERERRYREEKERRIAQHKVYEAKRKETIEKIAARAFARVYIEPLIPNVYEQLHLNGYFSDSIQNEIEEDFIPELLDDVSEELNRERAYRLVVDSIIREAVTESSKAYAKHDARDPKELEKLNLTNEENAIEKSENHGVNQPIHESNDRNATSNNDEIHNQEG